MRPDNPHPLHVWASQAIKRRDKNVVPMGPPQHPDNYLVCIEYCPQNHSLWTLMTLKAWEEDLYDEGNVHAPWYPLIGDVVLRHMEFKNGALAFRSGHAPNVHNFDRESVQYALNLFRQTKNNILAQSHVGQLNPKEFKEVHAGGS